MKRSRRHITQRDARRLAARVVELEAILDQQRSHWRQDYPDGAINIDTIDGVGEVEMQSIRVARMLGHAVVAIERNQASVALYALQLPKVRP